MEDLTDSQIGELKTVLENIMKELTTLLAGSADAGKTVDLDLPIGRLTRMDAMQQQKMEEAALRQTKFRLEHVKVALRRMNEEDYGTCRRCEEPIGMKRLRARPEAPFCLDCQNASEKRR